MHFQLRGAEQSEDVEKEARAARFFPFLPFLPISQRISVVVFLPFGPPAHNQSAMLHVRCVIGLFFFYFKGHTQQGSGLSCHVGG